MQIDQDDFAFFADFLKQASGYHLTPEKKYLLEGRVADVMKMTKITDVKTIISMLRKDRHSKLADDVIEAMTINETFFFRDQAPFESFENRLLLQLAEQGQRRPARIWSAACSTGQEAYSIAMIIEENKHRYPPFTYEIVGTDINSRVLTKARHGIYSDLEVHRGLPEHYRQKYFVRDGSHWLISDPLRKSVTFRTLNLRGTMDIEGLFDFVLLRNVLIYFDAPMKEEILYKVSQKMRPEAPLLLGAAEGIYDPAHFFQRCSDIKGLYRYRPQSILAAKRG